MRVLIACERSAIVRREFAIRGHDAVSCDTAECENPDWPGRHIRCDVLDLIASERFDLMIAHPPCTYIASSGLHWNKDDAERREKTERALDFVRRLLAAPIDKIAVENPRGCISTRIRPADQYIQPFQFGDDASKITGLWLKCLPRLRPRAFARPRYVGRDGELDLLGDGLGVPRWSNQTDSGQNKLPPTPDRAVLRSRTYPGIAAAMAEQWG